MLGVLYYRVIKRIERSVVFSIAVTLVIAIGPAAAEASWTEPIDVSPPAGASTPDVAVDDAGNAVFTWVLDDGANTRIQARARSADGVLSPIQTLSGAGQDADDPQVAVDSDGDAVFTWVRFDGANFRAQTRARSASGALSPVRTLSRTGSYAYSPQVGVDADGDAVFGWFLNISPPSADFRIQTRARSAAGALSKVQNLTSRSKNSSGPRLAVNDDGDTVFAWQIFDGANTRMQARARSAAGVLAPVQRLGGQDAFGPPGVAIDPGGDALFTWARFIDNQNNPRSLTRARSADGVLGPIQKLGPGDVADVAVDADGDAVFSWRFFDGTDIRVQARARSGAGTLSPTQTLSPSGGDVATTEVAVDVDGNAVIEWERFGFHRRVVARTRSATAVLGPMETLSSISKDSWSSQLAVAPNGAATVAWTFGFQGVGVIQAAFGP